MPPGFCIVVVPLPLVVEQARSLAPALPLRPGQLVRRQSSFGKVLCQQLHIHPLVGVLPLAPLKPSVPLAAAAGSTL